jgi:hypothetical protein
MHNLHPLSRVKRGSVSETHHKRPNMKSVMVYQSLRLEDTWIVETIDDGRSCEMIMFLGTQAEEDAHTFGRARAFGLIGCSTDQLVVERAKLTHEKRRGGICPPAANPSHKFIPRPRFEATTPRLALVATQYPRALPSIEAPAG